MDPLDRGSRGSDSVRSLKPDQRKTPNWLRILAGFLAVGVFLWLQLEDSSYSNSLIAALLITLVVGAVLLARSPANPCLRPWVRYPSLAIGLGLCLPFLAGILMIFKSGLHGHGFPDYGLLDYVSVIRLTPLILGGALILGLVTAGWVSYRCQSQTRPGRK